MLNKELFLISKDAKPHIMLTVGRLTVDGGTSSNYLYGYDTRNIYGGVDKIPFWNTPSGDMALNSLFFSYVPNRTYVRSDSKVKDSKELTISTHDKSISINLCSTQSEWIRGDGLTLKDNLRNTIPITFDPPDGYI